MRPLILIDVDGVLNPWIRHDLARQQPPFCDCHSGWVQTHARPHGGGKFTLLLNPAHGPMLLDLAADTDAELAWGSTWEHHANQWIGPLVGLPELPVGVTHGGTFKADTLIPWCDSRPFVWFDDDETELARADGIATQPHLSVHVDEETGLTGAHIVTAKAWLMAWLSNSAV